MDIEAVDGKYAGRAALLSDLREFVSYYVNAKGAKPANIHVDHKKLGGLFDMAKRNKIDLGRLTFSGIPLELV